MHLGRFVAGVALVLAAAINVPRVAAQESSPQYPADIREGSCAAPGDSVATLTPLAVPQGETQGPDGATPVAQSVTEISLLVPDLLGAAHVVMVYPAADQTATPMICGEIGGVVGEDGSLTIGLQATNGAKVSGMATFAPTHKGDGTNVSVNLIDEQRDRERAGDAGNGGGDASSGAADGENGGKGRDGRHADDGDNNADASAGSNQDPGAFDITRLNPNVSDVLPGADHQPGAAGSGDHPGPENGIGDWRDRIGQGGKSG